MSGGPATCGRWSPLRDVIVVAFSLLAAVFCGLTWLETQGLSEVIARDKNRAPTISAISERLHMIEVDLAEIRGVIEERAMEAVRGGK